MNIDEAFDLLIDPIREGGYQDGHGDPGGETKYGISKRRYPDEDIRNLTAARAKELYLRDFWTPAGCPAVPDGCRFDLFDVAVNSGPAQAIRLLQRAVGAVEDGALGPKTLQALAAMPPWRAAVRLTAVRLNYQTGLPNWPTASRGWSRRDAANLLRL